MTADPVVPAGFSVEYELFFFAGDPLVRLFFEITNTGNAPTTATIEIEEVMGQAKLLVRLRSEIVPVPIHAYSSLVLLCAIVLVDLILRYENPDRFG